MNKLYLTIIALFAASTTPVLAQDNAANNQPTEIVVETDSMQELLDLVEAGRIAETAWHRQREAEFLAARDRQDQLLREARQTKANEERRSERLEGQFQRNEVEIANLQQRLNDRLGNLSELFGVLQQVAGDARGVFAGSTLAVHYPDRDARLENLIDKAATGTQLPSIAEIEGLWFELQREMTESSTIVRFPHQVASVDGQMENVELIRVGDFNLVANGKYYVWNANTGRVDELAKQPSGRFTSTIDELESAQPGEVVEFGIDPSRGQLLSILVQSPSLEEKFHQGGFIGYVITAMGVIGILFVLERFFYLTSVTGRVRKQMKTETPDTKNPLGRILQVYQNNKDVDVETLELKLDEAILKETPALERFLTIIKIISAVAPLFGLLGTVTGMIATFQAITLFGTGDPKLMAGGISTALVTTVLGLTVAIPTLFLHSFVAGLSKKVVHILEEQSAGIIAVHAEKANK